MKTVNTHHRSGGTRLQRLGWAGFLFFLAKGLGWLALGGYLSLRGLPL